MSSSAAWLRSCVCAFAWLVSARSGADALGPPQLPPSPFRVVHETRRTPPYLDATAVCFPPEIRAGIEIAARLRDGDIDGVRRAFGKLAAPPPEDPGAKGFAADLALLRAIVDARIAVGERRIATRSVLRRFGRTSATPGTRACALLESARLAMLMGRPLDARVDRLRGRREYADEQWPAPYALTAAWLEAEELHRSGDAKRARALWSEISDGSDARLALAARLRLLETRFPVVAGPEPEAGAAEAWATFPIQLENATTARLDIEPWSLVAGELAIRAGDLEAAHYWLARAELAWRGGLASIRKSDVLVALGRMGDARNTLDRVVRVAKDPVVREMAELRIASLEIAAGQHAAAAKRIDGPARSVHPEVRAEALMLRARDQLASGQVSGALDSYVRLAHAGGRTDESPTFRAGLADAARALTTGKASCPLVLQELGSRVALLARYATESAPLLRVGDCFLTLNMPGAALDAYRAALRRFGAEPGAALPLRIATAALADGDNAAVRAAVEAALASAAPDAGDPAALRWRWLALALAEREGRAADASLQLDHLARAERLPRELRAEVELALVRRMETGGSSAEARAALAASLAFDPDLASDARGYAWLRLADLALSESDATAAASAYDRAAQMLAPGPLRDRARHHAALLVETKQQRREALATAAEPEPGSGWSRVAGLELRLQRLAEQVDGEQARIP